jgi:hypothetical protein
LALAGARPRFAQEHLARSWPVLGSDALGSYATYPGFTNAQGQKIVRNWDDSGDGQVRQGVPAVGNFVLPTSVGIGYVSPGYVG